MPEAICNTRRKHENTRLTSLFTRIFKDLWERWKLLLKECLVAEGNKNKESAKWREKRFRKIDDRMVTEIEQVAFC